MDSSVTGAARELAVTRRIPAPPEAVFAAWTDPDQLTRWCAPRGMTVASCGIDLRAGGRLDTVIRDASGAEYPNPLVIEAVRPPHRLVLRVPRDSACCPFRVPSGPFYSSHAAKTPGSG